MTKLFLFDVEGTTTDINFVHKVLFPYAKEHLETYVLNHQTHPVVIKAIEGVRETAKTEEGKELSLNEVIAKLQEWIKADRKHGSLKEIQGLIWDVGYSKGDFKGHVYADVKPFFKKILDSDAKVGIYSSGSVQAQKLIFGFSIDGDLTPMISCYFDTKVGGKREAGSYLNIANEAKLDASDIHFFSDIPEELEAAQKAGMKATQLLREGTRPSSFEGIADFTQVKL